MTARMRCGKIQTSEAEQDRQERSRASNWLRTMQFRLTGKGAYSREATVREKTVSEGIQ